MHQEEHEHPFMLSSPSHHHEVHYCYTKAQIPFQICTLVNHNHWHPCCKIHSVSHQDKNVKHKDSQFKMWSRIISQVYWDNKGYNRTSSCRKVSFATLKNAGTVKQHQKMLLTPQHRTSDMCFWGFPFPSLPSSNSSFHLIPHTASWKVPFMPSYVTFGK